VFFWYVAEVFSESRDGSSITGTAFVCAFHTLRMSIVSFSKFKIFSFLSISYSYLLKLATFIKIHVPF
jgi:hypothetical protein